MHIYNFNWRIMALCASINSTFIEEKNWNTIGPTQFKPVLFNCKILTHCSFTGLRQFPHHYLMMFTLS